MLKEEYKTKEDKPETMNQTSKSEPSPDIRPLSPTPVSPSEPKPEYVPSPPPVINPNQPPEEMPVPKIGPEITQPGIQPAQDDTAAMMKIS